MTALPVGLLRTRPLANADLEQMPDDGHRYELRTLVAFERRDGGYEQVALLAPDDSFDFERPFPVRISMAELCRGLDPD